MFDQIYHLAIGLVTFVLVFAGFLAWRNVSNYLSLKRAKQLIELRDYETRLKTVVSELLAQVNDIDQATKYLGTTPDPDWSRRLQLACGQLVTIGNSLPTIETLLDEEKVGDGRDVILNTCLMASAVSEELKHLRRVEPRLTDKERS